ncbi:MAG: class I SAM-dependent methyltransferase [Bacteroidetes bacterium]|nr:class I SAM-dependent methyltransferase [Bacteroidota bacterium]
MNKDVENFQAKIYDYCVSDYPGEIDFYLQMSKDQNTKALLELGCGTGRISIKVAQQLDIGVFGLDKSSAMLDIAKNKSKGMRNVDWICQDMRNFNINKIFDLIIIPNHSFQYLLKVDDQMKCLNQIRQHLCPRGTIILHLANPNNPEHKYWINEIASDKAGVFELAESFFHPKTFQQILTNRAWWYQPKTQIIACQTIWNCISNNGGVLATYKTGTLRFRRISRFDVEHLLVDNGFHCQGIYGDFFFTEMKDYHSEMIFVARNKNGDPG